MKFTRELRGPFFRADPAATFRQNCRTLLEGIVTEGAEDMRAAYRSNSTGRRLVRGTGDRVADHVRGRIRSLGGRPWALTGVASVSPAGLSRDAGVSLLAAASRLETRHKATKRSAARARRSGRAAMRNLLDGIA